MALERVQKILAKAGIASRRKAEELIEEGQVTINGKVAQLGDKAEWGKDAIKIKGKLLQYGATDQTPIYLAFYKPRGVISMLADPEGRPTLADYLTNLPTRVFPMGRLDFNSEGLLLLTNDGDMAEKIQKSDELPRVYQVKIRGHLDAAAIKQLEKGGKVEDRMIRPYSIRIADELASKSLVEIAVVGSGAQDIKAYFELKGFLIEKITRTAIGNITLRGLMPGQFKSLKDSQVQALIEQPELGIKAIEAAIAKDKFEEKTKINTREEGSEAASEERPRGRGRDKFAGKFDDKPRFGGRGKFGDKPRFGARDRFGDSDEKPRFGGRGKFGGKPRFEGRDGADEKPRFGGRGKFGSKPRFEDRDGSDEKPRFGGRGKFGGKPRFEGRDGSDEKPRFGGRGKFGGKPRFEGRDGSEERPRFGGRKKFGGDVYVGSGEERTEKPRFSKDRKPRGEFGAERSGGFGFGAKGRGKKPGFRGRDEESRGPRSGGFGNREVSIRPRSPQFGGGDDSRPTRRRIPSNKGRFK
jgi:23S rRNA pseudouridine2605 synthase